MAVGLANDTSPSGRSLTQIATVTGVGLSVPIANRGLATEAAIKETEAAIDSMATIRDRIAGRLADATPENRRWVLQALTTRVTVNGTHLDISLGAQAVGVAVSGLNARGLCTENSYRFSFAAAL